jgi:hydrogenase maturation protease
MTPSTPLAQSAGGPRLLVAGVGNIFLGDDAFGCAVAQRLAQRPQRAGVRVIDFGIRGLDLTYALLDDGYEAAILIDAMPRRAGAPGTLYVLEPEADTAAVAVASPLIEAHSMDPMRILQAVSAMGGRGLRILMVGCDPDEAGGEDMQMEMSPAVQGAVEKAVELVESLVDQALSEGAINSSASRAAVPHSATGKDDAGMGAMA